MPHSNLPAQVTSFVGRTEEITDISNLLGKEDCHLLTLLGAGGIGKTRLAIEVARTQIPHFTDGIYFIGLQALSDATNILPTIAGILAIQFHNNASPLEQLLYFLHDKQILLVIDNFEHLLDGADLLAEIIQSAPQVQILVTSREALNLQSEWLYPVKGMHYPQADDSKIEAYSAVRLFAERAKQIKPNFSLEETRECVARVCHLVEGMPLAIELAAGWLKRLSCADIGNEIERNLDFLATNLRGVPDRHRSIRAVFAHSWQLLSEDEQVVFMKLSVFRGGCTREAAEAVANASLYLLSDLVDKSLLRVNSDGRYDIHELLRQYAEEKLDEVLEIRSEVLDIHCQFFMDIIVVKKENQYFGWRHANRLRQNLQKDDENILQAWQHAIKKRKLSIVQKSLVSIGIYYDVRDMTSVIIHGASTSDLFQETLDILRTDNPEGEQGIAFGYALAVHGSFLSVEGKYELAIEHLEEGVRILRHLKAWHELVWALSFLNISLFMQGKFAQAGQIAEETLELARTINNNSAMGNAVNTLAMIERLNGNYRETQHLLKKSAQFHKQSDDHNFSIHRLGRLGYLAEVTHLRGDYKQAQQAMSELLPRFVINGRDWNTGQAYEWLGHIEHALGNYVIAEENLLESLRYAREHGDTRRLTFSLIALGDLYSGMAKFEQARQAYQETVDLAKLSYQGWQETWALRGLAQLAYSTGDYQKAQEYGTESLAKCHSIGWKYGAVQANNILGLVAVAQGDEESAKQHFYESLASELVTETPPVILETLYGIARLSASEGNLEEAVELLSLILADEKTHADTKALAQSLLDELQAELTDELFESAFERGQNSDLEEVVATLQNELSNQGNQSSQTRQSNLVESLSEREIEVLQLVALGRSNREIATELYLALGTVKSHVHNISGKLGASNRTEAVANAREVGLL